MASTEEDLKAAYEFRHAVTRDAAYQMLLPSERSELHRQVVDHLNHVLSEEQRVTSGAEILAHIDAINEPETLGPLELAYLKRAAGHAIETHQSLPAIEYLERIRAHELADVETRMDATQRLGATLLALGRMQEAAHALSTAIEEAHAVAPQHLGSLRGGLAGVYMESGRTEEAGELFELAIQDSRAGGNDLALGRALTNRAILYRHIGKDVDHESLLKEALEVHRRVGNRSSEGLTLMALGGTYRTGEDNAGAEELYRQALAIFRELGDRPLEAQVWGNLANVYLVSDRNDEAGQAYVRALRVMRELGRRRNEAILLGNYAQLLQRQGRLTAGLAAGARAVSILESLNDLMLLPPFRAMHASNLTLMGDFEGAERHFQQAENELSGDANVGALDHLLPARFRFFIARACGGFGPGRDPAARELSMLGKAEATITRLRNANKAKSSSLTSVINRSVIKLSAHLNKTREQLQRGSATGLFNGGLLQSHAPSCRKALVARLLELAPEQLRWMQLHEPEVYAGLVEGIDDLPAPDWRSPDIPA
ncbi:MAG: tetratricopeptide repeat protein [Planctomycetes bacterium]|nr:tetratricopeptide repeat protein [Planctomycetota bacterium]